MKDKLTIISDDLNHDIISELEARKQLFILLGVVCSATKCMACEVEIKKNEGLLFCADCGL